MLKTAVLLKTRNSMRPTSGPFYKDYVALGPEAAQRRFEELFPAKKDEYDVDVNAIAELGTQYMQKGDMESGMLFVRMMGTITSASITAAQEAFDAENAVGPTETGRARW